MKLYKLLIALCLFGVITSSCNKNVKAHGIVALNKKEYIEYIHNLPADSRQSQLKADAEYLEMLLDSIGDIRMYFSFSFGSGSSMKEEIEASEKFILPLPESVIFEFNDFKTATAEQNYSLPYSTFNINTHQNFMNINEKNIEYQVKEAFLNGKVLSYKDLGLIKADSIFVTASYTFPVAFDTLIIDRKIKDDPKYKDYTIYIDEIDDNSIDIEYPIGMNFLDYQAISTHNILMNRTNYSNFPVFGLKEEVKSQLKNIISTLHSASKLDDIDACRAEIEKISEDSFSYLSNLNGLTESYHYLDLMDTEDMIKEMKSVLEKHADILGPTLQHLSISFPQNYSKILFYIATDTQTISRDIVARCEDPDGYEEYKTFLDIDTDKTGIIDSNSDIIIPADYNSLYQVGELYFYEYTKNNTITYYLNAPEKKLEKLPENIRFTDYLGTGLAVFMDDDEYKGVLLHNKTQIIPYQYDYIFKNGNILIAQGSKRGREYYDFYRTDGERINLPPIKDAKWKTNNPNIIIYSKERKYGMVDGNGVLKIPIEYTELHFLNTNLLKYTTADDEYDALFGILNRDGKILSSPIYERIEDFYEDRASISIVDKGIRLWGFINEEGERVIGPRFSSNGFFYKGNALVSIDDDYVLIDKDGKILYNFPKGTTVYCIKDDEEEYFYQTQDGMKYDYAGKQINN